MDGSSENLVVCELVGGAKVEGRTALLAMKGIPAAQVKAVYRKKGGEPAGGKYISCKRNAERNLRRKQQRGNQTLKEAERAFLLNMLINSNIVESMKQAGFQYKDDEETKYHGEVILSLPRSKMYMEARRKALKDSKDIDVSWIVKEIRENLKTAKKHNRLNIVNEACKLLMLYKGGFAPEKQQVQVLPMAAPSDPVEYEEWLKEELSLIEQQKGAGVALAI